MFILTLVSIVIVSILYRNNTHIYLLCMGREEAFKHDLGDFTKEVGGGVSMKMELLHPFRILLNISTLSFIVLVPVLYYKIFTFRKFQDSSVQGL